MEKLFSGAVAAFTGWIGYVHTSRPSRKECEKNHEVYDAKFASLHEKIDVICLKIDKTNDLLIQHISNNKGA